MGRHRSSRLARRQPTRAARRARGGFTLIELAIAISIFMIGMVSVVSATTRMHSLRRQNRERTLAQNAVRSMSERVQARSYELAADESTWSENLLALYGPEGSAGETFDVEGLDPSPGNATVGALSLIVDETQIDAVLGLQLGLPRDLNGDGDALDTNVSADAVLLPCTVTLDWSSHTGEQTYRHGFYVLGF